VRGGERQGGVVRERKRETEISIRDEKKEDGWIGRRIKSIEGVE
jgi:hypothetical protein